MTFVSDTNNYDKVSAKNRSNVSKTFYWVFSVVFLTLEFRVLDECMKDPKTFFYVFKPQIARLVCFSNPL